MRRFSFLHSLAIGLVAASLMARPASAHGWGGFRVQIGGGFYGFPYIPLYAPPPIYYPPPAYYPPQAYYPPAYAQPAYPPPAPAYDAPRAIEDGAESCDAGRYICPMDMPVAVGAGCYCPANHGGRVYGHAQ